MDENLLYYIFILHQTTTPEARQVMEARVVLYLHSTSNHNLSNSNLAGRTVVLYLHSTSNHNLSISPNTPAIVVLYLHSTSNHNPKVLHMKRPTLYYIFILHQTTTLQQQLVNLRALYYIFILHQTTTSRKGSSSIDSCIISSFYIKPQLRQRASYKA